MVVTQENVAVNGSRNFSSQDIADALRDRIRAGDLKAGDRLPTQAELAEEFGVERGTVRQALSSLQSDGLLSNTGRGARRGSPRCRPSATNPRRRWWAWRRASPRRSRPRTSV